MCPCLRPHFPGSVPVCARNLDIRWFMRERKFEIVIIDLLARPDRALSFLTIIYSQSRVSTLSHPPSAILSNNGVCCFCACC